MARHAAPLETSLATAAGTSIGRIYETMIGEPVNLDEHRGMAAQKATGTRRQSRQKLKADLANLRLREQELEYLVTAPPAETWPEVAVKARYLIQRFAATPEAQEPLRRRLVQHTLDDLARLCFRAKKRS